MMMMMRRRRTFSRNLFPDEEAPKSVIGPGNVKIGECQNSNFVLLQYLTARQSSLFSHSNIIDGDTWNIHSLHAVKACLPRPFHDRERQDRRLGTSQLQIGKTQRPKTCDGRSEERLIFDNVSLVKLKALT